MQAVGMDRAAGLRHGGPGRVCIRRRKAARLRREADFRFRFRHGCGAHRDDEVRHQRDRAVFRRRYAIPGAVKMKIITKWLRAYLPGLTVDDARLAEALTLRGIAVEGIYDLGAGNGSLYEMDITTNRVDAMNHYGVAREAAAIYGLQLPQLAFPLSAARPGTVPFQVQIEAQTECGRFTARVLRGITIGDSRDWFK